MNRCLLGLVCLTLGCGRQEVQIQSNAAWSEGGGSVLLMASAYSTRRPSEPFYNVSDGRDWQIVFYDGDEQLQRGAERLRLPDLSDVLGGGMLYGKLWYLDTRGLVVSESYGIPHIIDLDSGEQVSPMPPDDWIASIFDLDTAEGLLVDLAPSPDGDTLAIVYQLATIEDGPAWADIRFITAVAFFSLDLDATYLGGVELSPWRGDTDNLQLLPPIGGDWSPSRGPLPTLMNRSVVLWKPDSSGVFVIDGAGEDDPVPTGAFVSAGAQPSLSLLAPEAEVPARALPTVGGSVRADGTAIILVDEGGPNDLTLALKSLTDWVDYGALPTLPLSQVDYAF